jgi:flagellar M-ring protein FliF
MLAMPQANGFFREQQKPTASVTVQMHPGRTLEREQIAGIVHLVASSVPELNTKAVSVVDGNGALLWPQDDRNGAQGFDSAQLRYLKEVEQPPQARDGTAGAGGRAREPARHRHRRGRLLADRIHRRGVQAQPGRCTGRRARHAHRRVDQADPAKPSGVPGAASNQPPVPATAPINGASAPLQGAQGGGAAGSRREAETNYAVDRRCA